MTLIWYIKIDLPESFDVSDYNQLQIHVRARYFFENIEDCGDIWYDNFWWEKYVAFSDDLKATLEPGEEYNSVYSRWGSTWVQ